MNSERIVLIGAQQRIVDRALHLGLRPFLVQSPSAVDATAERSCAHGLTIDYEQDPHLVALIDATHRLDPFAGVLSLTEPGLVPAAQVAAALNLRGLSEPVVSRTRNKLETRHVIQDLSPVTARHVTTRSDVEAFGNQVGWPIVLKPRSGFAGRSVRYVSEVTELPGAIFSEAPLLAEEYLEGPEYSVEAFSWNGEHVIAAINRETNLPPESPNPFLEYGHQIPAPLTSKEAEEIERFTTDILDALGITDGPSHTEIILTADGPRLVETHNRLAGDKITELIQLSTGIDLVELALEWAVGRSNAPVQPLRFRGGSAIRFFLPPPGKVTGLTGVERNRYRPGVKEIVLRVGPGDVVGPLVTSMDRVGYVIATGRDSQSAAELADEVVADVRIEVAQ